MTEREAQILKSLEDSSLLQWQVTFSGSRNLADLETYFEAGEYEFDFMLAEFVGFVRSLVGNDNALYITVGREYSTVMYVQIIPAYFPGEDINGFFQKIDLYAADILAADEISMEGESKLRIWWD